MTATEGKTKSLRQWRFTSIEEVDEQKILKYIHHAIEAEVKGLRIQPTKFSSEPIPQILLDAFKTKKAIKSSFEKLTPGKQKEYILYLNEAKQEITRNNRLKKIIPMITDGKGLNDQYKK